MARPTGRFAPGTVRRGLSPVPRALRAAARASPRRYFFWKSVGGIGDMIDLERASRRRSCGDVLALRMGRSVADGARVQCRTPRVAQMLDHFTQYVGSSPDGVAGGAVRHRPHADERGRLVPARRHARRARGAGQAGRRTRRRAAHRRRRRRIVTDDGGARARRRDRRRASASRCDAVVSNMDAVRTHRELLGRRCRRGSTRRRLRAGLFRRRALPRPRPRYDHLLHHDFVFSRDPEEEFDSIYRGASPAPDPTCYLARRPARTEPAWRRPAARRSTCWSTRRTCGPHHDWSKMLARLPAGRSSTS